MGRRRREPGPRMHGVRQRRRGGTVRARVRRSSVQVAGGLYAGSSDPTHHVVTLVMVTMGQMGGARAKANGGAGDEEN